MTHPDHQRWMQQWRAAAPALAEIRRRELAALTPDEALAIVERILTPIPGNAFPIRTTSGLVEQQRLFHRKR